jgi:cholesterol oxidase
MNDHFDAVVVGSGFGGAVMTYRLAEAGLNVCLLERGQAYPPNSFPRTPSEVGKNFWDPSEGLYGLYNIWAFQKSGAIVSSGLGGGSLIYANVLIRKDEGWFKDDLPGGGYREWPVQYKDLDRHYGEVERMMNIQQYPFRHAPFDGTKKTIAMEEVARKLNPAGSPHISLKPLNLAVSFRCDAVAKPDDDPPTNPPLVGAQIHELRDNYHTLTLKRPAPRSTCRLCGECFMGCNTGSKNTLDFTYLTAAMHLPNPPVIKTLCEVKSFQPRPAQTGYDLRYVQHDPSSSGKKGERSPQTQISCDRLILSAGALGTPYLLLKNAHHFPGLSKTLGHRFSVNGDMFSLLSRSSIRKGSQERRPLDTSFGPVITRAIRFGDVLDGTGATGRGFYLEEGGNPALMSWFAEVGGALGFVGRAIRFAKTILLYKLGLNQDADLGAELSTLLGPAEYSMSSLPLLIMGRDTPSGRLYLRGKKDRLACEWSENDSKAYFDGVRKASRDVADALNAKYKENLFSVPGFKQFMTAHPLGGCAMARNEHEGVVSACGEVFSYPGLYVADGSIMPGPVGPNPSLTIAALANRFAEHIIAEKNRRKHDCH